MTGNSWAPAANAKYEHGAGETPGPAELGGGRPRRRRRRAACVQTASGEGRQPVPSRHPPTFNRRGAASRPFRKLFSCGAEEGTQHRHPPPRPRGPVLPARPGGARREGGGGGTARPWRRSAAAAAGQKPGEPPKLITGSGVTTALNAPLRYLKLKKNINKKAGAGGSTDRIRAKFPSSRSASTGKSSK